MHLFANFVTGKY